VNLAVPSSRARCDATRKGSCSTSTASAGRASRYRREMGRS